MALAANGSSTVRSTTTAAIQVANAVEVYNQGLEALGSRSHGTAATRGRVKTWSSAVGEIPLGFAVQRQTGNTSGSPIPEAEMELQGRVMKNQTVAGLAGTQADVGRKIYATDDGTFTITRPAAPTMPLGLVIRSVSATNADIFFLSFNSLCTLALAGGEKRTICLGSICPVVGTAYMIGSSSTGIVWRGGHTFITDAYSICVRAATDADVSLTVILKINDVAVTGASIALLFSDAVGAVKASTAITALNVLHEGDKIQVASTQVAAPTATDVGTHNLYIEVEHDLGL